MHPKEKQGLPFVSMLGCTNAVWIGYLRRYGFQWKYLPRVLFVTLTTLLLSPLRAYEHLKFGQGIRKTAIHDSPVFIIGHWRSGTSLLHNALSVDPQFGYVSYLQGLFPHCFRNSIIASITRAFMPPTRPMDNMEIGTDSPQEEELALISQSGHSVYNMWISPDRQLECWRNYGLLDDPAVKRLWSSGYMQLLRTATHHHAGKRLLLKNPANTVRIPYLLEKFPNAKFIYIYRNPYRVYESTIKLHRNVIRYFQLKDADPGERDGNIISIYRDMLDLYDSSRSLIPAGNLLEIRYEDFVEDKLSGLERVYAELELGEFSEVEKKFVEFFKGIENYVPNSFAREDKIVDDVNRHWSDAFDRYGYERQSNATEARSDV